MQEFKASDILSIITPLYILLNGSLENHLLIRISYATFVQVPIRWQSLESQEWEELTAGKQREAEQRDPDWRLIE